jgi:hypothetical protein
MRRCGVQSRLCDAIGLFEEAGRTARGFAMAHWRKAWVFAVANDPAPMAQARALIETA